jgi:GDP-L-fucose synthase
MRKNSLILVVGATGLIGRACVNSLLNFGFENILTPNRSELDLLDKKAVNNYFANTRADVVILAAGKVGGIQENQNKPVELLTENLTIHLNVCAAAQKYDCKKVVLLGSSCMYPKFCSQPMPVEALFTGRMESTSLSYALAKHASLQLGLSYNKQFSTNKFICLIPNSAYGPGDNFDPESGHVVSSLISRFHTAKQNDDKIVTLWGSGEPRREFIFSEDIADAIIFILMHNITTTNKPLNIGSGLDYSIRELANTISAEVDFRGMVNWDTEKPDGAPQKMLDTAPLGSLGWRAKTDLRSGIQQTYAWFLSSGQSAEL